MRYKEGLEPLSWSTELHDIAFEHSQNIADGTIQYGLDGSKGVEERQVDAIAEFDNNPEAIYGENIGRNNWVDVSEGVEQMFKMFWPNEDDKKANILGDYTHVALAVVVGRDTAFYTQIFVG